MQTCTPPAVGDPASVFYAHALTRLQRAGIPFMIGGAFAFSYYSKIARDTKDLDVFVRPEDCEPALSVFARAGYQTELPFPHWLGKVHCGPHFIDVIFNSGNGVARVDDRWFEHAPDVELFGVGVQLSPAEEMIWSKAFVQERERFDGADVLHLIRAIGTRLDWTRLLERFGDHWRVLLGHLMLFGYVYPDRRDRVPAFVMDELLRRLAADRTDPDNRVCYGTLLSREQYLVDLEQFDYRDGRTEEGGPMTAEQVKIWTEAIDGE
jgi:hypothetical protein